jgi:hypothetical protein
MQGQRSRRRGHLVHEAGAAQRRHRVLALADTFEDVSRLDPATLEIPGVARDPELVLDAIVERLEILVADRPILDSGSGRDA